MSFYEGPNKDPDESLFMIDMKYPPPPRNHSTHIPSIQSQIRIPTNSVPLSPPIIMSSWPI